MKVPLYSYRDNKVGFMSPFVDQNEESAKRGFAYAINSQNGVMGFAPGDFDLYQVGVFDSESGMVESMLPKLIVSGASVVGAK